MKAAIDRKLLQQLKQGTLNNRTSVLALLESLGLIIERATKKSISISHPAIKKNIRLKGAICEEGFRVLEQRPHIIEDLQKKYERTAYSRSNSDLITWTKGMSMKKEYHQQLYGDIKVPKPLELNITVDLPNDKAPTIAISTPRQGPSL